MGGGDRLNTTGALEKKAKKNILIMTHFVMDNEK